MSTVTPADVLRYTSPTPDFLCPLTANTYGIDFLSFKIRDADSGATVFEVSKDPSAPAPEYPADFDYNQLRSIHYTFPAAFLRYTTVSTTLRFRVGPQELHNFRMIERHYSSTTGVLMKSYDFNFNFCIPNSTNEWEAIYDMPALSQTVIANLIADGSVSDSFYFVNNQLIMHNKAKYKYEEKQTESKANH